MLKNALSAEAPPQTPLGELTASPRPLAVGGEGRGGEGNVIKFDFVALHVIPKKKMALEQKRLGTTELNDMDWRSLMVNVYKGKRCIDMWLIQEHKTARACNEGSCKSD